jgi:hypothetical protein
MPIAEGSQCREQKQRGAVVWGGLLAIAIGSAILHAVG